MLATLALVATLQDPNLLPIGDATRVDLKQPLTRTASGNAATLSDVTDAAKSYRYMIIGESHDNSAHHQFQADVITALVKSGRDVVVGFEMFTRPNQINLNPLTLQKWDMAQFEANSNWKTEWGFDFKIYQPVFETIRENRLPMLALNVPRDWVRSVGRGGLTALSAEQQSQIPAVKTDNKNHRMVFDALMGGHPMTGAQGENIYAAQVLWDTGMADTAVKYMKRRSGNPNVVCVILAGSGHAIYGQGINYQIGQQTGEKVLTLIAVGSDVPAVSRGIGEFVFKG